MTPLPSKTYLLGSDVMKSACAQLRCYRPRSPASDQLKNLLTKDTYHGSCTYTQTVGRVCVIRHTFSASWNRTETFHGIGDTIIPFRVTRKSKKITQKNVRSLQLMIGVLLEVRLRGRRWDAPSWNYLKNKTWRCWYVYGELAQLRSQRTVWGRMRSFVSIYRWLKLCWEK